ncbi:hypothetical protein [Ramlibacter sp.]|uniref:hypothetical protein n=1 Tax=Ramlibacter sp. TaxID=1917967 RepID=UPI003D1182D0
MPSLNCRPQQLAWVAVPRTPHNLRWGLDQIDGHVVRTVRLVGPDDPVNGPCWDVTPSQCVTLVRRVVSPLGEVTATDVYECVGIPDAWLRPFDETPAAEAAPRAEELST